MFCQIFMDSKLNWQTVGDALCASLNLLVPPTMA
jgi:hypothetical protein